MCKDIFTLCGMTKDGSLLVESVNGDWLAATGNSPRRDASGSVQKLTLHTAPINRLLTSYECPGAFSLLQWHAVKTAFPWVVIKCSPNIHFSYSMTLTPQSSENKKQCPLYHKLYTVTVCLWYCLQLACANSLKLKDFRRFQFCSA